MRNTDRRGLIALVCAVAVVVVIGVAMLLIDRQPKFTPASATGSLQEQLHPRTNPPH